MAIVTRARGLRAGDRIGPKWRPDQDCGLGIGQEGIFGTEIQRIEPTDSVDKRHDSIIGKTLPDRKIPRVRLRSVTQSGSGIPNFCIGDTLWRYSRVFGII